MFRKFMYAAILATCTFSLFASTVETKFKAKIMYTNTNGKTYPLFTVRLFAQYENKIKLRNIKDAASCVTEVGREDMWIFSEETNEFSCLTDGENLLLLSYENMLDILERTWTFSPTKTELYYVIHEQIQPQNINSKSKMQSNLLIKALSKLSNSAGLYQVNLKTETTFVFKADNGIEKFEVTLVPTRTSLIN